MDVVAYVDFKVEGINEMEKYNKIDSVKRGFAFENLVANIFTKIGWKSYINDWDTKLPADGWDIVCEFGVEKCFIEVKANRTKYIKKSIVTDTLFQMVERSTNNENDLKVLVLASFIRKEILTKINNSVVIIDIGNLLFLVQDDEYLKNQLLSFIEFTIDDVEISAPNINILRISDIKTNVVASTKSLIRQFENWDCKENTSVDFEKLCSAALRKMFIKELSLWREQKQSNDNLFRFDLICKIKDDDVSPFWQFIGDYFNTKYVIFEFKNYKNPITQKEIYTTEKYLYAKALRKVAIIISANGNDGNSDKAIKGILREEGKLIISLSNIDIINMLVKMENHEEPSDYIYDKLDEMLIELDK